VDGVIGIELATDVPGHPPALVQVDSDLHRIPDGVADGRHGRESLLDPVWRDAQLERAEALFPKRKRVFRPLLRGAQLARGCIHGEPADLRPE
jgi:hypothetical protein